MSSIGNIQSKPVGLKVDWRSLFCHYAGFDLMVLVEESRVVWIVATGLFVFACPIGSCDQLVTSQHIPVSHTGKAPFVPPLSSANIIQ